MALTFEYYRGGEVLGGDTLGGSTMEYWRGGEVHQFFSPDGTAGITVNPSVLSITFATLTHSTFSDQVLSVGAQNIVLATSSPGQTTDQILAQNVQNYVFNTPTPTVNPVISEAKSSRIIIDNAIRI